MIRKCQQGIGERRWGRTRQLVRKRAFKLFLTNVEDIAL